MSKKKTWEVPLIKGTNIVWTETWKSIGLGLDYCDPDTYRFDATVEFYGICKGYGSGCKMFVKDTERTYINRNGETEPVSYGVFLCDSYDIVMKMDHGIMTGTFEVSKRGQDYGIKLVN